MNRLFTQILERARTGNKLIAVRTNKDDSDKFSAGYVLGYNEQSISIQAVTPGGLPGGVFIVHTRDLYGLDFDDQYLRKLQVKIEHTETLYRHMKPPALFFEGNCDIRKVLEHTLGEKQLLYINLYQDIGFYGIIQELNEEAFLIELYREDGEQDGLSVYLIDDIRNIRWDDEDNRLVEIMRNSKHTKRD